MAYYPYKEAKAADTCGFAFRKKRKMKKVKYFYTIILVLKYEEIKGINIKIVLS